MSTLPSGASSYSETALYPGSLGAASLTFTADGSNSRAEWAFVANGRQVTRQVRASKKTRIYADARPPFTSPTNVPLNHRAQQGFHYLRAYYPLVDVPVEILDEHIRDSQNIPQTDLNLTRAQVFDPLKGDRLIVLASGPNAPPSSVDTVLSAGGQVGEELLYMPLDDRGVPSETPRVVCRFPTEIQQIEAFTPSGYKTPLIVVRTLTSLTIHRLDRLQATPTIHKTAPSTLNSPSTSYMNIDLDNDNPRPLAEFIWNQLDGIATHVCGGDAGLSVVSVGGTVSLIEFRGFGISSARIVKTLHTTTGKDKTFFRVLYDVSDHGTDVLLASDQCVEHFDTRSPSPPSILYSLAPQESIVTSIDSSAMQLIGIGTTDRVAWIDQRQVRGSLFTWKHHRDPNDRTLEAKMLSTGRGSTLTFLTSSRSSLVSIYDVHQDQDHHFQTDLFHFDGAYHVPHTSSLFGSSASFDGRSGIALIPRGAGQSGLIGVDASQENGSLSVDMYELSARGALDKTTIKLNASGTSPTDHEAASDEPTETPNEEISTLYEVEPWDRQHKRVDIKSLYAEVVQRSEELWETTTTKIVDRVALLQMMPRVWQTSEEPITHGITSFDVAFRTGAPPQTSESTLELLHRADFFTSTPPLRLSDLENDSVIPAVTKGSTWNLDLSKLAITKELFSTPHDDTENEAVKALAVDIALSRNVFFPRRPLPPKDNLSAEQELLSRTRALSVSEAGSVDESTSPEPTSNPPAMDYGYLRPVHSNPEVDNKDDRLLGARLLLSEWKVGESPAQYTWRPPGQQASKSTANEDEFPASQSRLQSQFQTPFSTQSFFSQPSAPTPRLTSRPSFTPFFQPPMVRSTAAPPQIAPTPSRAPTGLKTQRSVAFSQAPPSVAPRPSVTFEGGGFSQDRGYGSYGESQGGSQNMYAIASSQVLPGKHGGRPSAVKKPPKKRVGGF